MKYLQRALSLRVIFGSLFVALVAAVLLSLLWQPLGYLFFPIFGLLYASAILNEANVITCPYCRKSVKLGAGTCSHCGRDVNSAARS
jgi:hypothetical protein